MYDTKHTMVPEENVDSLHALRAEKIRNLI